MKIGNLSGTVENDDFSQYSDFGLVQFTFPELRLNEIILPN